VPAVARARELGRGERVLPGLWRLRLPLPWPGVPRCNAWAIAAGSGIVLVDTGMHEPGSMAQLERALDQVNLRLEHVRLLACTHAHSDHWGQAAPIRDRTGCEFLMHARLEDGGADRSELAIARRLEIYNEPLGPEKGRWLLTQTLSYLDHLKLQGSVAKQPDGKVSRWVAEP
jgi:glyoxylase-like metal-dependent hydrolase (beta-lactamase superfamily II)